MPFVPTLLRHVANSRGRWLALGIFVCTWGNASAMGPFSWGGVPRLLSEILVPLGGNSKSNASSASANASEARRKARAESEKTENKPLEGIIVESDEQEGFLSRARVGVPTDNRSKALNYINGKDGGRVHPGGRVPVESTPGSVESSRSMLERNREKAQRYSSDGSSEAIGKAGTFVKIGTEVGVVGADGIIWVACDATSNTAGRIGDDTQSGNYFNVVVNGKMAKARCK